MMTLNNAESLSALFKKDRELPILTMIEHIRSMLQQWFYDRREESQNCTSVLVPAQEDRLFKTLEVGKAPFVEPLDQFRFSVRCGRNVGYIVDLNDNTCTLAMYRGFPPHSLCSHYYMADFWRAAHAETIFPLPNEVEWEVPDYIVALNYLLPPEVRTRTPGRRRTSRIPSTREFPQSRKCERCGATGHTRRFCTSQIPLNNDSKDV
ncbi:uncharacterized protein LOC111394280 [Olea europaea var. sylvestris]|uniref:uncharacterized protein LOC111394280 n=1 Tax=Olea europaea var. sylvestris TaxID=158386 RepID=UPI000C1CCF3D|nr:uncharacterized protein LOC111394280 [Olea europaea var. sylvestris]